MGDRMNDKMREEFEAAIAEEAGQPLVAIQLSRMADSYSTSSLIYAWWAWRQSRKALVIELPDRFSESYQDYFGDVEGGSFNESKYINDLHKTLDAAGLKVKP
jgi:hypothetical protein